MTLRTILTLLLVLASLILVIQGQSCTGGYQYSPCSGNWQCACLQLSFSSSTLLCGLQTNDCSQFSPCQSPQDSCPSGSVCVRHPRCDSQSLCYPMSMLNDQACPPASAYTTYQPPSSSNVLSNYTSALTSTDGTYTRPNGGGSGTYYEAIQLHVPTSGYYNLSSVSRMDTHGYLYDGTFYPSNPQMNLIAHDDDNGGNSQFKMPVYLEAGKPYTLVVTTHSAGMQGPFSVTATGPNQIYFTPLNSPTTTSTTTTTSTRTTLFTSSVSSNLTTFDQRFDRTGSGSSNFYYDAYEIVVNTTGTYTFTSSSGYDTRGYLYQGNFYPFYPSVNIHAQDDDGAGSGQFRVTAQLRAGIKYILVFTTHPPETFGAYSVTASGPEYVDLRPIHSTFS